MANSFEINSLKIVKAQTGETPSLWRIVEHSEGFTLGFTFSTAWIQLPQTGVVQTRRGEPKLYKSLNACFADIKKVSADAVIEFCHRPSWPRVTGSYV